MKHRVLKNKEIRTKPYPYGGTYEEYAEYCKDL